MNLEFAWWWMFGAIPLVFFVVFFPIKGKTTSAVYLPFSNYQNAKVVSKKHIGTKVLLLFSWALLVTASARPQLTSEILYDSSNARNLVLAIDISKSMLQRDMQIGVYAANRLEVVKSVLSQFIERRKGDQIGLVVFADNAYVQSPLSFDLQAIDQLVEQLEIGLAGERTSIGDGLVLAIKIVVNNPLATADNTSIILLSDGENTWGRVSPKDAMQLAREKGIRVHTIGFGSNNFGGAIDERTLREIAHTSRGKYFRATNINQLQEVYQVIDQLNRVEVNTYSYKKRKEIYHWLLLASLISATLGLLYFHWVRYYEHTRVKTY